MATIRLSDSASLVAALESEAEAVLIRWKSLCDADDLLTPDDVPSSIPELLRVLSLSLVQPYEPGTFDAAVQTVAVSLALETRSMQVVHKQIAYLVVAIGDTLPGLIHTADVQQAQLRLAGHGMSAVGLVAIGILRSVDREATRNPATGMLSKKPFQHDLERALSREDRSRLAIAAIDLDGLKFVNEDGGHLAGDNYLRAFGVHLTSELGEVGEAYHLSGDEFATIVRLTEEEAVDLLDRIRASSPAPFSLGVANGNEFDGEDVIAFFHLADTRQLEDKRTRRAAGLAPRRFGEP